MAKIAYLLHDNQASEWYRAFVPGQMLIARGHDVSYLNIKDPLENFLTSDVVIFIRSGHPVDLYILNTLKEANKYIIVDIDDNPWALPKSDPRIIRWETSGSRLILEKGLGWADLITVTSEELLIALQHFNPNIEVLENCLPDSHWKTTQRKYDKDSLVIGWAGGITHNEDLKLIVNPLLQILEVYPHVELHLAGNWDWLINPFPKNNRIKVLNFVPIDQYHELLAGFDIGIAPLIDTPFNRYKSDLKFLEYAALGIPCLASAIVPYTKSIVHGKTGFFAENDEDWKIYLRRLIESIKIRREIGKAAQIWSKTRMISTNINKWEKAYHVFGSF